jgi:UDP-glucose 4-epimerase
MIEVFWAVANYLGLKVSKPLIKPVNNDDISEIIIDPSLTEKIFKWKATTNFKNIIHNQLKWYDEHGVNNIFSHLTKPNKNN